MSSTNLLDELHSKLKLTQANEEDIMRSVIAALLLMLCVRFGRSAPYGNHTLDKRSAETCKNIRLQADRIIEMLISENFAPTPSSTISSENVCGAARCAVLQTLGDYYNCEVIFQKDGNKIKNEIQGLIDNLQMLRCSDEEKTCNLSNPACLMEIQQLSLWNKTKEFVDKVIGACLHIMQDVCPKLS
ncbi:hypothetical protein QQF64_000844 [Cirrhinus molitorella]|uniref:Interleukin-12 subunit alpha n=1 Tax=Cirrhinus molitorella TaxID=172907 RepID=A0ABR3NYI9_9TELE